MDVLAEFAPWWQFGAALLIGALLGLEREFVQQKEGVFEFAGVRTFSLITLLGAVAAYMEQFWGPWTSLVVFCGLVLLSIAGYWGGLWITREAGGITTEVAALLAYLLGALVMKGHLDVAATIGVVTALVLAFKAELHGFIRRMSAEDIRITLQFALVSAVILPLLPNRTVDPWGIINPFQIWMMVVLISGVGFVGYVLMKWLGPGRGSRWIGAIGGLVSSTAVTLSMAARSREAPVHSLYYAQSVLLAASIMLPRILFLVAVVNPKLVPGLMLPLGLMFIVGLIWVLYFDRQLRGEVQKTDESLAIEHPLAMSTAIKFGLAFALVKIGVKVLEYWFGSSGVYLASTIAGLTDVDAITLSVAQLTTEDDLVLRVAMMAILLAAVTNTLVKGVIARMSGSRKLGQALWKACLSMALVGVVSGWVMFFLLPDA